MELLIGLSAFIALTALALTVLNRPPRPIDRRLQSFRDRLVVEEQPQEKDPTFVERVLQPIYREALRLVRVVLPPSMLQRLQWRLTVAGDPVTLTGMLVIWSICAFALPALLFLFSSATGPINPRQLLLIFGLMALGGYLPHFWLNNKTQERQKQVIKRLPDAIDLLSTSVEAGLGIDAALGQVAEKVKGPISQEIRRMLREMAMGSARRDALKGFAERTQVPDVKLLVNALIQAEEMGVSLAAVIRVQAEQMRTKRRQRAEEAAHKAPVKITIPLVLFIFPTILVVILGPAAIQLKDTFGSESAPDDSSRVIRTVDRSEWMG